MLAVSFVTKMKVILNTTENDASDHFTHIYTCAFGMRTKQCFYTLPIAVKDFGEYLVTSSIVHRQTEDIFNGF